MSMDWQGLREELNHWDTALPIWWRDDDAVTVTPELEALAQRSARFGVPVHLAVVPAHAQQDLVDYVQQHPNLWVLVHGWSHDSHAPDGAKNSEFGTLRDGAVQEAGRGLERLRVMFGTHVKPVFVPPWNRVHDTVVENLPEFGFKALSTFKPRKAREAAPGLVQINTHIDPVEWRGTRSLADPEVVLSTLVQHLQDRRLGRADRSEPLGLLTHHLMQDDVTWAFCEALLEELLSGPGQVVDPFDFG